MHIMLRICPTLGLGSFSPHARHPPNTTSVMPFPLPIRHHITNTSTPHPFSYVSTTYVLYVTSLIFNGQGSYVISEYFFRLHYDSMSCEYMIMPHAIECHWNDPRQCLPPILMLQGDDMAEVPPKHSTLTNLSPDLRGSPSHRRRVLPSE